MKRPHTPELERYVEELETLLQRLDDMAKADVIVGCANKGCDRLCNDDDEDGRERCKVCWTRFADATCVLCPPSRFPRCTLCQEPYCPDCVDKEREGRCLDCEDKE
jgi:hypothetical protein